MNENDVSYIIRAAIFQVYNTLGPGLMESVYKSALYFELSERGINVKKEVPIDVYYHHHLLDVGFRIDLLVENKVIIEVKSIERLAEVHHKQVITYLKITGLKLGILVNFNVDRITEGIARKVNGLNISY